MKQKNPFIKKSLHYSILFVLPHCEQGQSWFKQRQINCENEGARLVNSHIRFAPGPFSESDISAMKFTKTPSPT